MVSAKIGIAKLGFLKDWYLATSQKAAIDAPLIHTCSNEVTSKDN